MKIQVIQRKFESDGHIHKSYKICNCEYCCDGIKRLPNVDFYYAMAENTDFNEDEEYDLGIMYENSVTYHDPWDYGDYGYTQEYYYKLEYCPICGEKIEVEIVDNVDISKSYNELYEERDKMYKAYIKTDSVMKLHEYLDRGQKLDRQIEAFYHTDRLPDKGDNDGTY